MGRSVTRRGKVIAVQKHAVTVAVDDDNDCSTCGIKSMCNREPGRSTVVIPVDSSAGYTSGEKVEITASARIQGYAVMIGILLPCGLLASAAALTMAAGGSETLAACTALGAVAAYYGILYRARKASARYFRWDIKKLDNNMPI